MNYDWEFGFLFNPAYQRLLLAGLWTTITITSVSIVSGTLLGAPIGFLCARESRGRLLRTLRYVLVALVDFVRSVPLLVLMLVVYYLLPSLVGNGALAGPWASATVAMTVNLSAFVADMVRASVEALPPGHVLAGRALGLNPRQILTWIVLPELIRDTLPTFTVLCLTMLKMSTLASAITLYEVLHSAEAIVQQTYRPLEAYIVVAVLLGSIAFVGSRVARQLERTQLRRRRI